MLVFSIRVYFALSIIITTIFEGISTPNKRENGLTQYADDDYWKLIIPKGINISLDSTFHIIKLKEVHHSTNPFHSCYNMLCDNSTGLCGHELQRSFCYPAIIVTGFPKCGTSAMFDMLGKFPHVIKMSRKENCPFWAAHANSILSYFRSLPLMNTVRENSLIIDGCIQSHFNMAMRSILRNPKTFYIFLIRDYANLLWSAYNFWCSHDLDGDSCTSRGRWTEKGVHIRSPSLFNDIVNGSITGNVKTRRKIQNQYPCPTSPFFITHIDTYLKPYITPRDMIVISNEELEIDPQSIVTKIAYGAGVDIRELNVSSFSKKRVNTQLSKDSRGVKISSFTPGLYEISNYQPMWNETRSLLNKCWYADCKLIEQRYGYVYPACHQN